MGKYFNESQILLITFLIFFFTFLVKKYDGKYMINFINI